VHSASGPGDNYGSIDGVVKKQPKKFQIAEVQRNCLNICNEKKYFTKTRGVILKH
jgi:hypothetical protein